MESIEARNEFYCPRNLSSLQCVILCLIFEQLVSSFRFIFGPRPPPTYEKKKSQQLPLWGVTLKATTRRRHVAKSHLAKELPQDEKPTEVASAGDAQQDVSSPAKELPQDEKPTDVASAGDAQQEVSSPAKELPQDEKPTEVASAGDAQQSIPSSNHIPFPET